MPEVFHFGPLHLYSFGFCVAFGVLVCLGLMSRSAMKAGMPSSEFVFDMVFITVIAGFLGARVFYILENLSWYLKSPLRMLAIWEGGLIFYGGVWVSFAALVFYLRRRHFSVWDALDFLAPYIALAHAFGRVGCFLNGCCLGKYCNLPWVVIFPGETIARHPAQLYEAGLNVLLFTFLVKKYDRKHFPGQIAILYFSGYSVIRFFIETVREGTPILFGLTHNQISSVLLLAAAIFLYSNRKRASGKVSL